MSFSLKFSFFSNERPKLVYLDLLQAHVTLHVRRERRNLSGGQHNPVTDAVPRDILLPAHRILPQARGDEAQHTDDFVDGGAQAEEHRPLPDRKGLALAAATVALPAGKAVGLDIPLSDQSVHFTGWVIAKLMGF